MGAEHEHEHELQTVQRLARLETTVESTHAAVTELGRKLERHMVREDTERQEWSEKLGTIAERVRTLPEWRGEVEDALRSLREWRAYLTGAIAVLGLLLVPLLIRWVERTFF